MAVRTQMYPAVAKLVLGFVLTAVAVVAVELLLARPPGLAATRRDALGSCRGYSSSSGLRREGDGGGRDRRVRESRRRVRACASSYVTPSRMAIILCR